MFLLISTHFTATLGIPLASASLKKQFQSRLWVKPIISLLTCLPAYTPFTPSNSGQRSPPTYYRGCWHVVSRGFLNRYRHYRPCPQRFTIRKPSSLTRHRWIRVSPLSNIPTAASRRSLGRVSVPMWPINLSVRLLIVDLVGRYLTNYLIRREPIFQRIAPLIAKRCRSAMLCGISSRFQLLSPLKGRLLTCYSPVRR